MRVLLDEQLPRHLVREIAGHDVSTVQQRGWAGLKNGELLRVAADAHFDVLVTADRNLQFQQNLSQSRLGISFSSLQVMPLRISVRSCQICSPLFRRAAPASCYA
jgi:hypothetical protein